MFSHIFIGVTDFDRALAFYTAVMDALGLERRFCEPDQPWAGWHSAGGARPLLLIGHPEARPSDLGERVEGLASGYRLGRYLKTLEKASHRLDLDGQQTAELTDEHRQHAAEQLRERFRKEAERRKAERAAEAAREAERIQTEKRAAKLNQLVEKFARNK